MNNIFAERLKKAMEQKNMKQIDLVKKAAVEKQLPDQKFLIFWRQH